MEAPLSANITIAPPPNLSAPPPQIFSTPPPNFNPSIPPPKNSCPVVNYPRYKVPTYPPQGHNSYFSYGYTESHNYTQYGTAPPYSPHVPPPPPSHGQLPPPLPQGPPPGLQHGHLPAPQQVIANYSSNLQPNYSPSSDVSTYPYAPPASHYGYTYPPPTGCYTSFPPPQPYTCPPPTPLPRHITPPPPFRCEQPITPSANRNTALIQIELKKPSQATTSYSSRQQSALKEQDHVVKRSSSVSSHRSSRSERNTSSHSTSTTSRTRRRSQENDRTLKTGRLQGKSESERERLLKTWRSQYCETSEEINRRLAELANSEEKEVWIRSSPAELYYTRTNNGKEVESTTRMNTLCNLFDEKLVKRAETTKASQQAYSPAPRARKKRLCRHKSEKCSSSDSSDDDFEPEEDCSMEELSKKMQHPYRLHPDLWHNESGEMNDGPLCRCSAKSRRTGIRHGIYPGETGFPKCQQNSNNAGKLYHYRITISPPTNFLTKTPTIIKYDQHEFLFEGFSLFSHYPIKELPTCKVIRFNIEYTILYIEEKTPENFTIQELDLFFKYLFYELLELVDFTIFPKNTTEDVCPCFHFLPRFVRDLEDNGKEVLSMCEVLKYLLDSSGPLVDGDALERMLDMSQHEWQDYVDFVKGMVATNPGRKPCSVRVDQLDRNVSDLPECIDNADLGIIHPVIVHFGIRPPQLSYAGNPEYQKAWKEYVKFRHLIANMSKPSYEDKRKLETKEQKLQEMRTHGRMKRNVTVAISSKGFYRTGIMCDIVQHAMLIPVLTGHLRFHKSLELLENNIDYKFRNRYLLQLALTHPSYKENFGTNPDHARNSLTNCGIRQPEYGDRKIHYMNTRKRGINTLINIMSRFGKEYETDSNITHNERLEFLGDAVVEFLSTIHLFFMFPELEEGGLATYRAAIVQNQHLAVLAKKLRLDEFMLYAHGSDLCHELELRHAMANCFEALMGALLLDGGISGADKVFVHALFMNDPVLKDVWESYPPHPLQEQEPLGDRKWIESYQLLKDLTKFEESIGVQFKHIRLLARAFTDRSIGFTHLTLGSNQRLEFLGDTVLQLISSEYLYRHFPEHHEGHLSLLRSSLVNNRTQAVVCDDLGMTQYAVYANPKAELKTKDRADLLEAFLGALYVDKGLDYCETFCQVCLFPRLQVFIMKQDWNDPKSKLQQCCLTLRTMDGGEPDIPVYKVIECKGPTNTRVYSVAVYFRGKRLGSATGHSIQQAEMNAAKLALEGSRDLFPQLDHQKRVIEWSIKRQKGRDIPPELYESDSSSTNRSITPTRQDKKDKNDLVDSNLPIQYRLRGDVSSSDEETVALEEKSPREHHRSPKKRKHKKHKKNKKQSKDDRKDRSKRRKSSKRDEASSSAENRRRELSPLLEDEVVFIHELERILDAGENETGHSKENEKHNRNNNPIISDLVLKPGGSMNASNQLNPSGTYEKEVACFMIEGAEEVSCPSDMESGEII